MCGTAKPKLILFGEVRPLCQGHHCNRTDRPTRMAHLPRSGEEDVTCWNAESRMESVPGRAGLDRLALRRVGPRARKRSSVDLVVTACSEGVCRRALFERREVDLRVVLARARQRTLGFGREPRADSDAALGGRGRPRHGRRVRPRARGEAVGGEVAARCDGEAGALGFGVAEGQVVVVGARARALLGGIRGVGSARTEGEGWCLGTDIVVGNDAIGAGTGIIKGGVGLGLDSRVEQRGADGPWLLWRVLRRPWEVVRLVYINFAA
jgi:hypothetical protein